MAGFLQLGPRIPGVNMCSACPSAPSRLLTVAMPPKGFLRGDCPGDCAGEESDPPLLKVYSLELMEASLSATQDVILFSTVEVFDFSRNKLQATWIVR